MYMYTYAHLVWREKWKEVCQLNQCYIFVYPSPKLEKHVLKAPKILVKTSLEFACLLDASHAKGNVYGTFNYQLKLPIWTILLITHFFSSHLGTSL